MQRYLRATFITLLYLSIIFYIGVVISTLLFPYTLDYGEAPLLDQARRIIEHQTLYKADLTSSPYVIANYPPIYPFILAKLSQFTGAPLLLSGRIISILATLVTAGLVASLARSLNGNKLSALVASGLFLGHPYVSRWSALARVDMLALMFCLLAIFIFYHRWNSWAWIIPATLCLLASSYTRQSYLLAGPLTALIWLWTKERKKAIFVAVFFTLSILGLFIAINSFTQGGFYLNIITANLNQFDFSSLYRISKQMIFIWPGVLLGCIVFGAYLITRRLMRLPIPGDPFIASGLLIFGGASSLSALTVGKVGSNVNYFMELITACALIFSVAIEQMCVHKARLITILKLAIIGQLIWLLLGSVITYQSSVGTHWKESDWYHQLAKQVQEAALSGPILSDDYLGMVVQADQPVIYQPFEYGQLYQAGLWDPQSLANEILTGSFSLILIGGNTLSKPCCWPPELIQAIHTSYKIEYRPGLVICSPLK